MGLQTYKWVLINYYNNLEILKIFVFLKYFQKTYKSVVFQYSQVGNFINFKDRKMFH